MRGVEFFLPGRKPLIFTNVGGSCRNEEHGDFPLMGQYSIFAGKAGEKVFHEILLTYSNCNL